MLNIWAQHLFEKQNKQLIWSNLLLWSWAKHTTKDLVELLSVFADPAMEENCIKKTREKGIWAVYDPTDCTT